ncbi:ABC transporter permease [Rhodococcus fascians]|uniref:ABC transporter permease n=1 Tax=Rhodococcus sp. 1R11 TaxID=2559614 RepID=UPI001071C025|nr:ABC transporter permease [Rhodococcus sp. 1R11]MBY3791918.1 ABC transporter permease [Rhodococcus fascians]MBY3824614.1 ABC transporter permease [Rhodococcus fascians]MBY3835136.1 ABC transporter permease [Rhodococcus fascians]MBY3864348.1 ABC transporter permease [Rhodococcus fascians]MBY3883819.1 ABC transporter permease [Rhodococcus fascians]
MNRILNVARVHNTSWATTFAWPLGILVAVFVLTYGIFSVVPESDSDVSFSGGVFSVYGFAIAFYVTAITQCFPYALSLSITRREFLTATALVGVAQSVALGTIIYLLSVVEAATDGFGLKIRMFGLARYATDNPLLQWLTLVIGLLLIGSIGAFVGVVYRRFRTNGLFTLGLVGLVVFGGGAIVITWQNWWPDVGTFFTDTPRVLLLVVVPLVITGIFSTVSWMGLLKASA